ncbi:MAG: tetratricopeptide repeat protein [Bacteroidia bacterium]|nr:tetratricopeptide repeat protein [Bacteroidia bacterium]
MKKLSLISALFFLIAACNMGDDASPSAAETKKTSRDSLLGQIEKLEKQISTQSVIDYNFAGELVNAYLSFFNNYPRDNMACDYLYKAADVSMNIKQSEKAIEFFKKLVDLYPSHKRASFALFMQGFIYETQLKDFAKAKEIYLQVIAQYPGTRLADDANASIVNLGKSDEEIIKEFEAKNKQ